MNRLLSTLKSCGRSKSKKTEIGRKIQNLAYFDQREFRLFLNKYRNFVMLTLKVNIDEPLDHVLSEFERICLSNGAIHAMKLFKELYNVGCRIATSNTFEPIKYTKSNSRGEPKVLGPLLGMLKGDLNSRRASLACLQIIKLVSIPGESFSTEGISSKGLIPNLPFDELPRVGNYFKKYIDGKYPIPDGFDLKRFRECYWRALELAFPNRSTKKRLSEISKLSDLHLSARNGPNGPCLSTVVIDHHAMKQRDEDRELLENIQAMSKLTNNKDLEILLANFEEENYKVNNLKGDQPIHSKISLKQEPWGKIRPFAICDYFSQSSLKGFHKYLFRWLAEQPEDGTFKQNEVSEAVRIWTESTDPKSHVESADLSEATNSIPLEVQAEMVAFIAGRDFAKIWMNIASNRDFKVPGGDDVRYGRGQPMGLLSSWAMLAVWHHIMVRSCLLYLEDVYPTSQIRYYVIGDDTAMVGPELFRIYEIVVNQIQGVGISKMKGFHIETQSNYNPLDPNNTHPLHTAELAKRIFCSGQEITTIPPDEVKTSLEKPVQFPELIKSLRLRQYPELDEISDIPALAAQSRDSQTALLLTAFPLREAPLLGNYLVHAENDYYSSLPWYKPWFNLDSFKEIYIETIRGDIIATLLSVTQTLNQWNRIAVTDGEVKVKSWVYTCETQGLVLYLTTSKCKGMLEEVLSDTWVKKVFPNGQPINWKSLKEYLQDFQTIFEIDLLYKEKNPLKDTDRGRFQGTFLWKALRSALARSRSEASDSK